MPAKRSGTAWASMRRPRRARRRSGPPSTGRSPRPRGQARMERVARVRFMAHRSASRLRCPSPRSRLRPRPRFHPLAEVGVAPRYCLHDRPRGPARGRRSGPSSLPRGAPSLGDHRARRASAPRPGLLRGRRWRRASGPWIARHSTTSPKRSADPMDLARVRDVARAAGGHAARRPLGRGLGPARLGCASMAAPTCSRPRGRRSRGGGRAPSRQAPAVPRPRARGAAR